MNNTTTSEQNHLSKPREQYFTCVYLLLWYLLVCVGSWLFVVVVPMKDALFFFTIFLWPWQKVKEGTSVQQPFSFCPQVEKGRRKTLEMELGREGLRRDVLCRFWLERVWVGRCLSRIGSNLLTRSPVVGSILSLTKGKCRLGNAILHLYNRILYLKVYETPYWTFTIGHYI